MKKKIIFMLINMNIGGTEKALLNMIAEMPNTKYDITIFLLEKRGGFLDSIPNDVRVEYFKDYPKVKKLLNQPIKLMIVDLLKKRKLIESLSLFFVYILSKVTKNRSIFFKHILKDVPNHKGKYDIAVAYAGPMDFISYFVVKKIQANKKIQWIHFDVEKIGFDKRFAGKTYKYFDKLFIVSKEGKQKLLKLFPELIKKVYVFPNIISSRLIIQQSKKGVGFQDEFDGVRILTVGRLSKEKGQDLVISAMKSLKTCGFNIRWYCLGEGPALSEYKSLIKKYNLEQEVILLGSDPNPYPFMRQCDLYVQPSRHEGYCITLAEARCFDKPIISTNFTGAKEQLINDEQGVIVKFDEQDLVLAIKNVLNKLDKLKCYGNKKQAN